jgi:DnaK suppressor protein
MLIEGGTAMTHLELRRTLEIQAQEYAERVDAISQDLQLGHSLDVAEPSLQRQNDELANALLDEARGGLQAVTQALARMEQGVYGRCVKCGEPIQAPRLAAMPTARFCLDCAQQQG